MIKLSGAAWRTPEALTAAIKRLFPGQSAQGAPRLDVLAQIKSRLGLPGQLPGVAAKLESFPRLTLQPEPAFSAPPSRLFRGHGPPDPAVVAEGRSAVHATPFLSEAQGYGPSELPAAARPAIRPVFRGSPHFISEYSAQPDQLYHGPLGIDGPYRVPGQTFSSLMSQAQQAIRQKAPWYSRWRSKALPLELTASVPRDAATKAQLSIPAHAPYETNVAGQTPIRRYLTPWSKQGPVEAIDVSPSPATDSFLRQLTDRIPAKFAAYELGLALGRSLAARPRLRV